MNNMKPYTRYKPSALSELFEDTKHELKIKIDKIFKQEL